MASDPFEFVILGAGAIGSIIGAHLARSGRSVAMFARGRRAAQVREQGLRISGLSNFVQPVTVLTDLSRCRAIDVLIVATKALNTSAAVAPFRSLPIGVALSIQNGIMKNVTLAHAFGAERVLGAIANTSGELSPTGEVLFTRNELIAIGETDGRMSERAQGIGKALQESGIRSQRVPDIETLEWAKFASWAGLMILSVATRATTSRCLTDPTAARMIVQIVREVGALAVSHGAALSDRSTLPVASICSEREEEALALVQLVGRQMAVHSPDHRMSSLQDLEAHRPLEIEETLGYALTLAAQKQISLPLVTALRRLMSAIDELNRKCPQD